MPALCRLSRGDRSRAQGAPAATQHLWSLKGLPMYSNLLRLPVLVTRDQLPAQILIVLWALGMIAIPIGLWTMGDAILPWAITLNVLVLAAGGIASLLATHPWAALRAVVVVLTGGWFVEYLGSTIGIPFGHYDYTPVLQPQLGGVPVLIPIAWLMMLPSTWVVAQIIAPRSRLWQILISGLAMTAWDLYLDPQMVAWNFWQWDHPHGYFGIPWINFVGWFVSAAALTWLANPPRLPVMPLLWVYTLTWALQCIGLAFFWGMPGPALGGFLGMGIFVFLAWRKLLHPAPVGPAHTTQNSVR